jgi:hypothetical protein
VTCWDTFADPSKSLACYRDGVTRRSYARRTDDDDGAGPLEDPPPALDPWSRQPGEPDLAWALFSRYVVSEATSIAAFARSEGSSGAPALAALAARWRWRARRAALEAHLHDVRISGAVREAREQGIAHARATGAALAWATESILARAAAGELLDGKTAIAAMRAAIELERLASGEPTARTAVDLSHVPDDALAKLRETLEAVTDPARAPDPQTN